MLTYELKRNEQGCTSAYKLKGMNRDVWLGKIITWWQTLDRILRNTHVIPYTLERIQRIEGEFQFNYSLVKLWNNRTGYIAQENAAITIMQTWRSWSLVAVIPSEVGQREFKQFKHVCGCLCMCAKWRWWGMFKQISRRKICSYWN